MLSESLEETFRDKINRDGFKGSNPNFHTL